MLLATRKSDAVEEQLSDAEHEAAAARRALVKKPGRPGAGNRPRIEVENARGVKMLVVPDSGAAPTPR